MQGIRSEQIPHITNRWVVLGAAGTFNALVGAVYVWSIFSTALGATHTWGPESLAFAYSLYISCECLSGFASGFLQQRLSPRAITLIAGCCSGFGWFMAGFAPNIMLLYASYSLLGGIGSGLLYNVSISTATAWFPDKRGLANGFCVGCTGLSPIIFAPLGAWLIQALGPSMSFHVFGISLAACAFIASLFMCKPPTGWSPFGATNDPELCTGIRLSQALRHPSTWMMWLLFALSASAGMMITGHAAGIGTAFAQLSPSENALQIALIALANFTGRMVFGSLSDHIGRSVTLVLCMCITIGAMLIFTSVVHDFLTLTCMFCLAGAAFGGVMATMPALSADMFGTAFFGEIYAFMFSGYTCASIIGPMLGAIVLQQTGSYHAAFPIAAALSALGIVVTLICTWYERKNAILLSHLTANE